MVNSSCKNCGTVFFENIKFCPKCGRAVQLTSNNIRTKSLNLIIAFYVTFLLFALIGYFATSANEESLTTELSVELVFAALVIGFCSVDYQNILKLYKFPKVNWSIWLIALVFPIFTSFSVYFYIEFINKFVFEANTVNYVYNYAYLENPLLWALFFIVILPPIFEELAFRGFLFNQLERVTSQNVTIVATAFIFALVHFSFISFFWIFPFGLVLGYLRSRYHTLWLGIIIHFIHNLLIVLLDSLFYFGLGPMG